MRACVMMPFLMRQPRISVDCMRSVVVTMLLIAVSESGELSARAKTWAAAPSGVPNSVPRHECICLIHMIKGGVMNMSRNATIAAIFAGVRAPATHTTMVGTIIVAALLCDVACFPQGLPLSPADLGRARRWR